jgi:ABC-2 type transport system permease protein
MTALVRAELLRLRTSRSTWALLAVAVTVSGLRMAMVLAGAGSIEGAGSGSDDQRALLVGAGAHAALLLSAVYGVLLVTGELASWTLTASLLITPDRRRVVLAKVMAGAAAGALVATSLLALGIGVAAAAGGGTDVGLRPLVGTVLMAAGSGAIGVGVGTVVRQQTAAVAVPVLWFLVLETLLSGFQLSWLQPWLPGGALAALSGARFAGSLPMAAAAGVVVAYAAALLLPGARSLLRRDVG